MIISASYKTDIPAFYGEWFMNRLRAGYCKMVNPYSRQVYTVPLSEPDVDGFVFWTKNLGPFLQHLPEVHRRGFPFIVQYSLTGYPRRLETSVVHSDRSVAHIREVVKAYGPRTMVWRYDPILFTSETDAAYHRANFAALASQLEGATDEVVISFAHIYQKTRRNLERAGKSGEFTWEDPSEQVKLELAADLVAIARQHGMQLTTCSQNQFLTFGARPARCVDANRLSDVAGRPIRAPRKGNRPDCECHQSRDIGDYDTCPHGCVYCYAVLHQSLAQSRFHSHDPTGEFLYAPEAK